MPEWIGGVASAVLAAAIIGVGTWLLHRWRARPDASQWTLQRVTGEEWTLKRDSSRSVFDLNVYELGDGERSPSVHVAEYLRRGDMPGGGSVRVVGLKPGTVVHLDWVERDERLTASVTIRNEVSDVAITRRDVRHFAV